MICLRRSVGCRVRAVLTAGLKSERLTIWNLEHVHERLFGIFTTFYDLDDEIFLVILECIFRFESGIHFRFVRGSTFGAGLPATSLAHLEYALNSTTSPAEVREGWGWGQRFWKRGEKSWDEMRTEMWYLWILWEGTIRKGKWESWWSWWK